MRKLTKKWQMFLYAIGGMGVGPMRKECAWDFDSARKVFLGGEGKEVAA